MDGMSRNTDPIVSLMVVGGCVLFFWHLPFLTALALAGGTLLVWWYANGRA